jgi:hypothetical protein
MPLDVWPLGRVRPSSELSARPSLVLDGD